MTWPYSVQEIATLYSLHKSAVLRWLKEGLRPNADKRPYLIRGDEIARFLAARQMRRKRQCAVREIYCFKCRAPREVYRGIADIVFLSPSRLCVKALCAVCSTPVNKVQAVRNLQKIQNSFHVQQLRGEHLLACDDPSVNSDLEATR